MPKKASTIIIQTTKFQKEQYHEEHIICKIFEPGHQRPAHNHSRRRNGVRAKHFIRCFGNFFRGGTINVAGNITNAAAVTLPGTVK